MVFLHIIEEIILPLVILIGVGVVLQRFFQFEMKTFSRLILYYYIPALTFITVYEASISLHLLLIIFGLLIAQFIILFLLGNGISRMLKHNRPTAASFSNSIILTNNGNIGIPVNGYVFHSDPFAMSVQMMVVLFEIALTFTFGLFNASAASIGASKTLRQFVRMPILYALVAGILFNLLHIPLPDSVEIPLHTVAGGMLSLALVSIGAQMAGAKLYKNTSRVLLSTFIRLLVAPLFAFSLLSLFHVDGIVAQALFIASAIPTSRNSAALALEYGNEPEFAAQAVLVSTLCSSVTLTLVIYLSTYFFA
ncbi:AEC family transporter [Cohnella mopanensis]|uniref:AEC family transporter n=1 Tax=Cohnella mopanensis TaxID=2911966 RepID=UPI001EF96681|nr:AEC family transporter [Cohnella mopanensis]